MSLAITGKLVKALDVEVELARREKWKKQSFVIDTGDADLIQKYASAYLEKIKLPCYKASTQVKKLKFRSTFLLENTTEDTTTT